MLHTLLVIIHILVCVVLSVVVLLQSSKGGGLAGAFGGGGGSPQQMLGSRGMTTLLHKLTIYFAVAFFLTSFLLFMTQGSDTVGSSGSIIQDKAQSGELNLPVSEEPVSQENSPAETGNPADDSSAGGGEN
ncbi:MAG: preprotein translocase subunit SecG [bacterium]|nr:preprotein translocase subunit SecG [bacterium]